MSLLRSEQASGQVSDQASDQLSAQTSEQHPRRQQLRYQPFYCEENIWWLCAEPPAGVSIDQVIFVAGSGGICPIAEQRAGGADGVAWWDYHCIALDHRRRVWDLDSRLPLPVTAGRWLEFSFPRAADWPMLLQPLFRLVPSADYLQDLCSHRHHMRNPDDGGWQQPPPPWPCIGSGAGNLEIYRDLSKPEGPGVVLDLAAFRAFSS
jgi:hypothetical protein